MKVVGKTDNGYLTQISREEIGIVLGFGRYADYGKRAGEFKAIIDNLRTNTDLKVIAGMEYHTRVLDTLKTARKTAKELRELADMLDNPIPTVIVPMEETEQ